MALDLRLEAGRIVILKIELLSLLTDFSIRIFRFLFILVSFYIIKSHWHLIPVMTLIFKNIFSFWSHDIKYS